MSSALLELTDSTVRCTLAAKAGYSRWLATRLGVPDLKERLRAGERLAAFEFRYNGYHIEWPTFCSGAVFKISQGDGPGWIVGLIPPKGYGPRLAPFFGESHIRRQWHQALDPTAQHVPSGVQVQRPYAASAAPRQWTPSTLPPPGWYPDPADTRAERYWDGTRWTSFAQPSPWQLDRRDSTWS